MSTFAIAQPFVACRIKHREAYGECLGTLEAGNFSLMALLEGGQLGMRIMYDHTW